jgi:uncharacterized protein (DUF362 family)
MTRYRDDRKVWVGHFTHAVARQSYERALDAVPLEFRPDRAPLIAIKINICDYRRAESGAVTDPILLGILLETLRGRFPAARLAIIENDATTVDIRAAYRLLGFDRVAEKHGAELRNVAEEPWIKKAIPGGVVFQELEVPAILDECAAFINFTKLKTNALTKMTGSLKNIFALLRMKRKVVLHGRIDQVLQDMNKIIIPDYCLVDGCIGMEGMGGPAFGRPKRCDLLIAGHNPVATDSCQARIMGMRPRSVKHIKLCNAAGLGPIDYELSTDIPDFDYRRYRFRFERWEYFLRNAVRSRAGIST